MSIEGKNVLKLYQADFSADKIDRNSSDSMQLWTCEKIGVVIFLVFVCIPGKFSCLLSFKELMIR